jgi:hypothetical protein
MLIQMLNCRYCPRKPSKFGQLQKQHILCTIQHKDPNLHCLDPLQNEVSTPTVTGRIHYSMPNIRFLHYQPNSGSKNHSEYCVGKLCCAIAHDFRTVAGAGIMVPEGGPQNGRASEANTKVVGYRYYCTFHVTGCIRFQVADPCDVSTCLSLIVSEPRNMSAIG